MLIYLLSAIIFISGIAYLFAVKADSSFWKYVLKPGTMVFIILLASTGLKEPTFYVMWVLVGLLFSVCGDIFLMLPSNKFLQGLTSFLIAHICYIIAFTNGLQDFIIEWRIIVPLALFGIFYYSFLYPSLKKEGNLVLQIGVMMYIAVICLMFTQSYVTGSQWAVIGSFSFLVSDAILAYDQFHKQFRTAHYYVMITYYLAQYLIALSLVL
ncbi:lysoplasmalogenase [Bacillus sp. FJAT-52991]|uniref:Lysoplasmalogenase n=1 Tax=Bacillus kandeliae TaxID=3129297 RepID=A0ABZ2N819_9BACI